MELVVTDSSHEIQEKSVDFVNHPPHYTGHPSGLECIDLTEHMNFCYGNAIKYLWRVNHKGTPIEQMEKARWYLLRELRSDRVNLIPSAVFNAAYNRFKNFIESGDFSFWDGLIYQILTAYRNAHLAIPLLTIIVKDLENEICARLSRSD